MKLDATVESRYHSLFSQLNDGNLMFVSVGYMHMLVVLHNIEISGYLNQFMFSFATNNLGLMCVCVHIVFVIVSSFCGFFGLYDTSNIEINLEQLPTY